MSRVLRQVLLEHCVSAADVTRSIAEFVPAPDDFGVTEPNGRRQSIEFHLWRGMVRRACREAEAAAHLDALLVNAEEKAPRWFAWDGQTGLPKISDGAKSDGHRILESLSSFRDRLLLAPAENKSPFRWLETVPVKDERRGDSARFERIGFIRDEIVSFLDGIGVPHSVSRFDSSNQECGDASLDRDADTEPIANADPGANLLSRDESAVQTPELSGETPASTILKKTAESDARVGWSSDPISAKIRDALRMARLSRPELLNVPTDDRSLSSETWEVLKGWALDCAAAGEKPGQTNAHFPIVGWDSAAKKVLFDPGLPRNDLSEHKLRRRLTYSQSRT